VVVAIAREMAAFLLAIGRDRHGNVIAGHGRLLAAQKLGGTEVPTVSWIT
jgi:ParB-like chromosome segregation protein Spo0J